MKIVLFPNVQWTKPFLEVSAKLVPVHKVKCIRGFTLQPHQCSRIDAQIAKHSPAKYTMSLCLSSPNRTAKGRFKAVVLEDALFALAHELAHLVHWEHTPEHLELTSKLLQRYVRVLRKQNVENTNVRVVSSSKKRS